MTSRSSASPAPDWADVKHTGIRCPLAQRLLESGVQLLRREVVPELQVRLHDLLVDFDHLLDDPGARLGDARQVGGSVGEGEEAIDHLLAAGRRKVDGQALLSERIGDLRHERREVEVRAVDLVHYDHTRKSALARRFHDAPRVRPDAGAGIDDHRHRLHRGQGGQRATDEIRVTGGIHEVDVCAVVVEADDRGGQRVGRALSPPFRSRRRCSPWRRRPSR